MRLLILEDDPDLGDALATGLRQSSHAVDWFRDGEQADAALGGTPYDALVLDLGLPGADGMTWLRRWRAKGMALPVLILTARDGVEQRIEGLDAGADDYLIKPIAIDELAARLRAMLRRSSGRAQALWSHGALQYDPATKQVLWHGREIELTGRELALLEVFLTHPQRVLSKGQLMEKLYDWSGSEPESNALEVHVHHLRRKIDPGIVRTVRGVGYALGAADERTGDGAQMSLQRRLLVYLLLCAPLVWGIALLASADRARHEVNELFDTEIIRLARQVQATLAGASSARRLRRSRVRRRQLPGRRVGPRPASTRPARPTCATCRSRSWNADGRLLLVDREGVQLPRRADAAGFVDLTLEGAAWRVYYLQSPQGEWLVAAGQRVTERDELVENLMASQLLPWLLVLPVLMAAMAWAVRQALAPIRTLAGELQGRGADDLRPVPAEDAPSELKPLLAAMNGLFVRIDDHAGARTPLHRRRRPRTAHATGRAAGAVGRGAWRHRRRRTRAGRGSPGSRARPHRSAGDADAGAVATGGHRPPAATAARSTGAMLVAQVINDVLPLAERRRIELGCDWPADGAAPFPLQGDADLLAVLLRNLLDNAVRYAPEGSAVTLRFGTACLTVENEGPPLTPEALARLGERFHRPDGQAESGSGLGVSIARRIAALHGLQLRYRAARGDGEGVVAELSST